MNVPTRFIFVEYETAQSAQQSLALNGQPLGSHMLRVSMARSPLLSTGAAPAGPGDMGGFNPGVPLDAGAARTVHIGNLDPAITPDMLNQYFGTYCGPVHKIMIRPPSDRGGSYGFLEFVSPTSVDMALRVSGQPFGSLPIRLERARTAIRSTGPDVRLYTPLPGMMPGMPMMPPGPPPQQHWGGGGGYPPQQQAFHHGHHQQQYPPRGRGGMHDQPKRGRDDGGRAGGADSDANGGKRARRESDGDKDEKDEKADGEKADGEKADAEKDAEKDGEKAEEEKDDGEKDGEKDEKAPEAEEKAPEAEAKTPESEAAGNDAEAVSLEPAENKGSDDEDE